MYAAHNTADDVVECPDLPEGWPTNDCYIGPFWLGWKEWLAARGYTLTLDVVSMDFGPGHLQWCIPPTAPPASFPYAHRPPNDTINRSYDYVPNSSIGWAKDVLQRDTALKIVLTGSDEYRVYQALLGLTGPQPNTRCLGVLRPFAILDTCRPFSFVALPRWGNAAPQWLHTVGEVMQFMRCTSQGLRLLHENRIVHRDISTSNVLINYFKPAPYNIIDTKNSVQEFTRSTKVEDVYFCLFDFDISDALPRDVSVKTYRSDSIQTCYGTVSYHPPDAWHGEPDYNPFAFDVGCLGNLYRSSFPELIPLVPLLAPLFDKMTTWNVKERFTASEAADFIERAFAALPADLLGSAMDWESECCSDPDVYWSHIPPDVLARWAHYRTPQPPWPRPLLAKIAEFDLGWRLLRFVRRTLGA
ncbi:hypothetical protein C8Q77DRAFT_1136808 [Trametes polyzona]|nr:hypothetical protein C8Q77DRAFT_1136808 [Trametes polyzona]